MCICQNVQVLLLRLLFAVLLSPCSSGGPCTDLLIFFAILCSYGGEVETGRREEKTPAYAGAGTHRHTHTHRAAAVLAGPLFPLLQPQTCIGDILQYTFYEPFPSHQCSRPAQLSVGESYGVVFSRLRRTDPTPRRRRAASLMGLRALGV